MFKKRRKKTPRQKMEESLDTIMSLIIRNKFKWVCQRCGGNFEHDRGRLQHAHVISRNKKSVRWEENNGLAMCMPCHIFWQHQGGNTVEFVRLAEHLLGRSAIDAMWYKSQKSANFSLADLGLLKRALEQRLEEVRTE